MLSNTNPHNDYIETLTKIKKEVLYARYLSYKAINTELIKSYLKIGEMIFYKVKNGWGNSVIDKPSSDLQIEFPGVKGFSSRNLRRMKQIYESVFNNEFWTQLVAKIPWGHSSLIFTKCRNEQEIKENKKTI